ncbi:MAG: hypothetical protein KJ914_07070 [Gammaproteobacteria bacterium]|nr:hypothetical protein [Gammaproteobacteria bacterium]MBU1724880.1 hypothetical protein [Gammaproteobacteria bacterium]MBU2004916.1 hypothetical protein [Gammaproteobacteria bacterium]
MNHPQSRLAAYAMISLSTLMISGCLGVQPAKEEPQAKSLQEIAAEAMNSKGKLTREQINALIAANAKCTPDKM